MKNILLAYDSSAGAEGALGDLTRAGLPADVSAVVLTVADIHLPEGGSPGPKAEDELQKAQKRVEYTAGRLKGLEPKWEIEPVVAVGSPARVIVEEARERGMDLLVMGASGHNALHRLFLGSVSAKVAAEASCSVRLFRPHLEPGFQHLRIIIAVDGSAGAEAAVEAALSRSWPKGSGFHVVAVLDSRLESAAGGDPEQWAQDLTQRAAMRIRQAGYFAEPHVLRGDPKKLLVRHAEDWAAHTVFVGATGSEHTSRLGTVAAALVGRSHCSVEIVR